MPKPTLDYSLYLVTGRELLPPGKDYYESLEESLQGGVTLVQVREKYVDTGEFIEVARRTKAICDKYNVPVLINDRIDVHLAVGTAGIHVGQTDCPIGLARSLVGPDAIIGLSVGNVNEAKRAIQQGADYVGIGAVWPTDSKDVTKKKMLGPDGVGEILDLLHGTGVPSVAIGGIHLPNVAQLLHASIAPQSRNALDGIAIISDIVASLTPREAAKNLREVVQSFKRARSQLANLEAVYGANLFTSQRNIDDFIKEAVHLTDVIKKATPLVNQMTNNVVINDSANVTLAIGASPIMATHPRDVYDLSPAIGALLINFGTVTDKAGMLVAGRQANVNRKPIVFDPVAIGATPYRQETSVELLAHWQPTIIKGNAAEIGFMAKSTEVASRGVDSVGSGFSDPGAIVKTLARKQAAIIVLTGEHDYISDGSTTLKISNGHHYLERITGSGCQLGSVIASFAAAARLDHLVKYGEWENASQLVQGDMLAAAVTGVLVYTIAAEVAAAREDVKGPGTFRAALIDELYNLTPEVLQQRANIEIV
ncbi:hydroxyethylthiazole kinase [Cryptococcus bacillisporus CA1873]|uniref:Hydroxyethylthiazole kinase n=1 Tax=Cryptococcus bacillisporus CA1873 TaxID=1296111 RepID=A0ABR5BAP8_CRYGA|nr:hydroxyethylthiazole kinase [Cryptococcus bacillisporus CA1873]|eukprot:KIR62454.1 hydroxyethylthiazole kinase [Cryptococcus gattii CA1873]